MADTVTVLKPVLVPGLRSLTPDRSTATSVRLDRGQVTRFLPSSAADALLFAPGVDLTRSGPWSSRVSMRGLSGERVLVMVDGVRLESGRGHGAQTSLVPVDRLESVEIQPGAGSAQFGSDALGGMVELSTHRPLLGEDRTTTLGLSARGSEPGDELGETAHLRSVGRRWGAELTGSLATLGALATPDGRLPNSGYKDQDVAGRAVGQLGPAVLDLEHTRHASRDIGLPAFTSSAGSHASFPLQSRDADRLELTAPERGARPALRLLAVQQRFLTHYDEVNVDSQFVRNRYVAQTSTDAFDRITTWARSAQPTLQRGPIRLYGEWRHENTSGPRSTTTTVTSAAGNVTSRKVVPSESVPPARREALAGGIYGALVRGPWRLESGWRYDWLHSVADSTSLSFTPRLDVTDHRASGEAGLSRTLGPFTPYLHLANGFRAPNLEERYFNSSVHGGLRVFGNPDLVPEIAHTYEVGVRAADAWGGHVDGARLSVYRSDVTDMITLVYLGQLYLVPRFQYRNVQRARIEGIESETDARWGRLQATLALAFPRGEDRDTGKPLDDMGAARATLDLRTRAPKLVPSGLLTLRARWTDATRGTDRVLARPAFWTFAAEASATVLSTRITLAVRNLLNTTYREPMSFVPEPGRTVTLGLRWEHALPQLSSNRGS